jgi:hypothetical protein
MHWEGSSLQVYLYPLDQQTPVLRKAGPPLHGGFEVPDQMGVEFVPPVAVLKVEMEFEAWLEVASAWSLSACKTCQQLKTKLLSVSVIRSKNYVNPLHQPPSTNNIMPVRLYTS